MKLPFFAKYSRIPSNFSILARVVCTSVLPVLSSSPAWAQSASTGTVSGQVTDLQNAVIAEAEVTLRILHEYRADHYDQ